MTITLLAALNEYELILLEMDDLVQIAANKKLIPLGRAGAEVRLITLNEALVTNEAIIRQLLEKMPAEELLHDITHNLSNKCN